MRKLFNDELHLSNARLITSNHAIWLPFRLHTLISLFSVATSQRILSNPVLWELANTRIAWHNPTNSNKYVWKRNLLLKNNWILYLFTYFIHSLDQSARGLCVPKGYALNFSVRNSFDLFKIVPTFAGCFDKSSQGDCIYIAQVYACV